MCLKIYFFRQNTYLGLISKRKLYYSMITFEAGAVRRVKQQTPSWNLQQLSQIYFA